NDEAARIAAARFADDAAEARTVFGAGDLARYADVVNRGHVHQEAAGKRDVAGNARALLAERLLGALHDNFLAGLQHFADELGAAGALLMPVMAVPGVRAMAAVSAATIEASTAAAISAATIVTPAAPTAIASAAEGPLKARTGIAAHAGGLAREFALRL